MYLSAPFMSAMLSIAAAGDAFAMWGRGAHWCRTHNIGRLMTANCDEFDSYAIRQCLQQVGMDNIIAHLVMRCPGKLPKNSDKRRFDKYAVRLAEQRMPMTFEAYLGQGRCARLTPEGRARLEAVMAQDLPLLRIFQRVCGPVGFSAPASGVAGTGVKVAMLDSSGRPLSQPFSGPIELINENTVRTDFTILTRLTPEQAGRFGVLNSACRGLTEAHFRQPGVSVRTVGMLQPQCFVQIPPTAFAGLSPNMIRQIRMWPFATKAQIAKIQTGDAIRALPFDQLGMGKQRRSDYHHPCYGITAEQRSSIRKSRDARREFYRRCRISAASSVVQVGGLTFLAVAISALLL